MEKLELPIAIRAVQKASEICQSLFKKLKTNEVLTKSDKSPVTIADFSSQLIVNSILFETFPHDAMVAEENNQGLAGFTETEIDRIIELVNTVLPSHLNINLKNINQRIERKIPVSYKGRFWTLDPIDGTKGFLRGDQYAVCLSLIQAEDVMLAVMGCPNLNFERENGRLFWALKGNGSYEAELNNPSLAKTQLGTRLSVSNILTTKTSILCESLEPGHSSHSSSDRIKEQLKIGKSFRMDSQCKYGCIARGSANIYVRLPVNQTYQEKIWDHASGYLLVKEAGGIVTDIFGKPLDFTAGITLAKNVGVVATNNESIHKEVIDAIRLI